MKKRRLMLIGVALLGWYGQPLTSQADTTNSQAQVGFYGTYHPKKGSEQASSAAHIQDDQIATTKKTHKNKTVKQTTSHATINDPPSWRQWLPQTGETLGYVAALLGLILLLWLIIIKKRNRGKYE